MIVAAPEPKENMGAPEPRVDARAKVTGEARYAADFPLNNPAYGMLVTSAIAHGRITAIDTAAAEAIDGVLLVMTHENRGEIGPFKFFSSGGESSTARPPLSDDRIEYAGEIVALVVADSFESARQAAYAIHVSTEAETPVHGFDSTGIELRPAVQSNPRHEDPSAGDAERALREADTVLQVEYQTPTQHHNAIELFSTTCVWNNDELTVFEPSQFVVGLQHGLARQL